MAAYQLASATSAGRTMAAEAGRQVLTAPIAFAGTTMLGYPVETPLETIMGRIAQDFEADLARMADQMFAELDLFVQAETIAAGADAASVEIVMEPAWENYVRVLIPARKRTRLHSSH